MASPSSRARRDATLQMADEFLALANNIADSKNTANRSTNDTKLALQTALDALFRVQGSNIYQAQSAASKSNMGRSGRSSAAVGGVVRQTQAQAGDVTSQATNRLMAVADELDKAMLEARRTKQSLASKKGLLIQSLTDKYQQEANQLAAVREGNQIQRDTLDYNKDRDKAERAAAVSNAFYQYTHTVDPTTKAVPTLADAKAWLMANADGGSLIPNWNLTLHPSQKAEYDTETANMLNSHIENGRWVTNNVAPTSVAAPSNTTYTGYDMSTGTHLGNAGQNLQSGLNSVNPFGYGAYLTAQLGNTPAGQDPKISPFDYWGYLWSGR